MGFIKDDDSFKVLTTPVEQLFNTGLLALSGFGAEGRIGDKENAFCQSNGFTLPKTTQGNDLLRIEVAPIG